MEMTGIIIFRIKLGFSLYVQNWDSHLMNKTVGGIVINQFAKTLEKFILLTSFMPIISALSGNLGLQTSSNITRLILKYNQVNPQI